MKSILFFSKKKIKIKKIFPSLKIKNNFVVNNIKPLNVAKKNDLSFFDAIRYKSFAHDTKATVCITTDKLKNYLPNNVTKIIVKNVLVELSRVIKIIYPTADIDYPDIFLKKNLIKKNLKV